MGKKNGQGCQGKYKGKDGKVIIKGQGQSGQGINKGKGEKVQDKGLGKSRGISRAKERLRSRKVKVRQCQY